MMLSDRRWEWRSDPCVLVLPSGKRYETETLWITVDDWRETVVGAVNFGFVTKGPTRLREPTP